MVAPRQEMTSVLRFSLCETTVIHFSGFSAGTGGLGQRRVKSNVKFNVIHPKKLPQEMIITFSLIITSVNNSTQLHNIRYSGNDIYSHSLSLLGICIKNKSGHSKKKEKRNKKSIFLNRASQPAELVSGLGLKWGCPPNSRSALMNVSKKDRKQDQISFFLFFFRQAFPWAIFPGRLHYYSAETSAPSEPYGWSF